MVFLGVVPVVALGLLGHVDLIFEVLHGVLLGNLVELDLAVEVLEVDLGGLGQAVG